MTFTKSYTTRRSQFMIRSRLRRPTSKSTTTVLWPRLAIPVLIEALVVVLPTPPFPEVTTIILAKVRFLFRGGFVVSAELSGQNYKFKGVWVSGLIQWCYHQQVIPELNLYSTFPAVTLKILGDFILSCDGHKLRLKGLAEYPG